VCVCVCVCVCAIVSVCVCECVGCNGRREPEMTTWVARVCKRGEWEEMAVGGGRWHRLEGSV